MPRVLRIINRLNLGGPTYNAAYLTKYLAPEFETMLLAGNKDVSEASSEFIVRQLGLVPHYIPEMQRTINPMKDVVSYQYIKKTIRQSRPDIVHTHAAKAGALGRLAAHQCKVPVILHTFHGHVFHSYFNPLTTAVFLKIERYLAKISTRIIAISEKQKEELAYIHKLCPPEKIVVIPLGFDLERFQQNREEKRRIFRRKFMVDDDEIAIGIIGRLVPIKNHGLFLKAIKMVSEKTKKKIRAFIVGDGESRMAIEQMATDLKIDWSAGNKTTGKSVVIFTSWIKEVDEVNAGMDIIALTSDNEGTPVSLIEAEAANKPIVTTKAGGVEDVVVANETALLSPCGDEKLFAEQLLKLIEDDKLRMVMGKNGYDFVGKKFDYRRLVSDTQQLYRELLKN